MSFFLFTVKMFSVRTVICVGFTLCELVSMTTSSWIYNGPRPRALASASASVTTTPLSHIADLRRKSAKAEQLQEEKNSEESEMALPGPSGESDRTNEVSPSLFQKKVVKILTKLRLLAQIKNAYHHRPDESEDSEENTVVNNTTSSVNITFEEPQVQKDLEVEVVPVTTRDSVSKVKNNKLKEEEPSRLSNLGIFFAELVGSIVGLTYGAVAQIASGGQNPVTISTSEGL